MKMMKRLSAILLVVLVLCTMCVPAFAAESSATYGNTQKFTIKSGSVYTATDMFDEFKGVMPGDVLTEKVEVKVANDFSKADYVKIFLKAVAHDDSNKLSENVAANPESEASANDFLKQMTMKIWNGSDLIYESTPDNPDELKNGVLLGSFRKGQGCTLTVELNVPITMGDAYSNRAGEVDWVFTAEEHNVPKTGDDTNVVPYVAALCGSVIAIVVILLVWKKRKNAEN